MTPFRTVLLATSVLAFAASASAQTPDPKAGQQAFSGGIAFCTICHGGNGSGGYGPDLAGTGLTVEQFIRSVRQPWGIMPSFPNIDDRTLINMHAWLSGLPKVEAPGKPRVEMPEGGPIGQRLSIAYACSQCHGPELADPRRDMGGQAITTLEGLEKILYDGERPTYEPAQGRRPNRMGHFSRERLPRSVLETIFTWMKDEMGLRPPVVAEVRASKPMNGNITYTLEVHNEGAKGKGLPAEGVTATLILPPDAKVVSSTGAGWVGVQKDPATGMPAAVWKVAKIDAGPAVDVGSITLAGATVPKGVFKGSSITWEKPAQKRPANQTLTDARIPPPPGDGIPTTGVSQRPTGQVLPLFVMPQPTE
ncbi:MAG: cytochrome c [Acidimicrobiia bacterium]|nr:cytochrome c [Acidimicrobiia bacterium]